MSFDSDLLNEGRYADIVSKVIGSDHIDSRYGIEKIETDFIKLADHFDEPFGDYSMFPTSEACKVAKESGYTVMISGDGADEMFGGYSNWYHHYKWKWLKEYRLINLISSHLLKFYEKRGAGVLKLLSDNGELRHDIKALNFFDYVSPDLYDEMIFGIDEINLRFNKYNIHSFPKNHMRASLLEFYLPEQVLVKVDRASMYNGIESRTPFLDHRLVEFVHRIPTKYHYASNFGKVLLRQLLPSNIPNEIRWRQKGVYSTNLRMVQNKPK